MEKKLFEVTDTCTTTCTYLIYAKSVEDARNSVCHLNENIHANDISETTNIVKAREIEEYDGEFDLVWDFDEKRPYRDILIPVSKPAANVGQ